MKLEEKLIALRNEQGFSQSEAAEKLNVSRQAISRWERGTSAPSIENLISLSKLYGVSLDQLLGNGTQAPLPEAEKTERAEELRSAGSGPAGTGQTVRKRWKWLLAGIGVLLVLLIAALYPRTAAQTDQPAQQDQQVKNIGDLPTDRVEISGTFSLSSWE